MLWSFVIFKIKTGNGFDQFLLYCTVEKKKKYVLKNSWKNTTLLIIVSLMIQRYWMFVEKLSIVEYSFFFIEFYCKNMLSKKKNNWFEQIMLIKFFFQTLMEQPA